MKSRAFITGVSGLELTTAEREFVRAERPWGFILFKRNVDTPTQVARLVGKLRDCVGNPEAPVLIDQEGGRVQRLGRRIGGPIRRAPCSARFTTVTGCSACRRPV